MANTIADKLTYLSGTKDAIKQAITRKGVSVSESDTFRSYADKIETIQTGSGGTVNIPDGTKFSYSKYTTVPTEILPYLEQQADMSFMFGYCVKIQTVPDFNTENVTDMSNMFNSCQNIQTVPHFNTENVTDMSRMFSSCSKLTTVPQFNTSKVTNMSGMFSSCPKLATVPQFNTSKVTNMRDMFYFCMSLETVPPFDTSKVTNMSNMFYSCSSLTTLGGFTGLKLDLSLSSSKLTVESVMNIITAAADMTSSPKTLTLHKTVFNKLSQEQITTASSKGWNIAAR